MGKWIDKPSGCKLKIWSLGWGPSIQMRYYAKSSECSRPTGPAILIFQVVVKFQNQNHWIVPTYVTKLKQY